MKKELKDYLHLYLGCEVLVEGDIRKLITIYLNGYVEVNYNDIGGQEFPINEIKPILRPLSDMTEAEKITYEKMVSDAQDYDGTKMSAWTDSFIVEISEHIKWLLSKHFDIFNLHDAGLCLYKNKEGGLY